MLHDRSRSVGSSEKVMLHVWPVADVELMLLDWSVAMWLGICTGCSFLDNKSRLAPCCEKASSMQLLSEEPQSMLAEQAAHRDRHK